MNLRSIGRGIVALALMLAPALVPCDAQGANVFTPIDSSYKLTFDDEFNGTVLDTSKWANVANNVQDLSISVPANVSVANGKLTLTSKNVPFGGRNYQGAFVTTNGRFSMTTGYIEARMSVSDNAPANSHGLWQSFWANRGGDFPEIDLPEWLGRDGYAHMTWHGLSDPIGISSGTACPSPAQDLTRAYHVYGALWTPTVIKFYVDGVLCFTVNNPRDAGYPQAINVIAAVGGWGGVNLPDSSTIWPAYLRLDYVHVYSNDPNAVAVTSQANYGGPGDNSDTSPPPPPPPPPPSFEIGAGVKAAQSLSVFNRPTKKRRITCTEPAGSLGTIVGGPTNSQSYIWWNVSWNNGCTGWSTQDSLQLN